VGFLRRVGCARDLKGQPTRRKKHRAAHAGESSASVRSARIRAERGSGEGEVAQIGEGEGGSGEGEVA
jgi:hypothetical protein